MVAMADPLPEKPINRELAAGIALDAAALLSRLIREKKIPESEFEVASDLSIDLHLIAKHLRQEPMVLDPQ